MKTSIIKIGNSQGLLIPKPILKQCGFNGEVELEVHNNKLVIKPTAHPHPRKNWAKEFQTMVQNRDDELIGFTQNQWDENEWEW